MTNYCDIDDIIVGEEIEAGSKVELPFWLAHELQLRQAILSVRVPPCFNQRVGDGTIGFLLSAFKIRYKEILTKAHTSAFAAGSKFWTILTKEEINLYETSSIRNGILQEVANGGS